MRAASRRDTDCVSQASRVGSTEIWERLTCRGRPTAKAMSSATAPPDGMLSMEATTSWTVALMAGEVTEGGLGGGVPREAGQDGLGGG